MKKGKILVVGASGQIGTELVLELRHRFGNETVVASDLREANDDVMNGGAFEKLDVMNADQLNEIIQKHGVREVYQLAALLSATAEQQPMFAWELNMKGLFNVLELAKDGVIDKVFWPSSIAVFGPNTPKEGTPQHTIMEPSTVYGISKQAGERWCEYYHKKYGVDVRGVRYPGLISYSSPPGGGTTDYAVEIFHQAKAKGKYTCFLKEDTVLPMMYMSDAIKATIDLMEAPEEKIKIRSSYNIAGFSFDPKTLAEEICKHQNDFEIDYEPDFRQDIANSWPSSIDDSKAREHWGWEPQVDLGMMVDIMLSNV